MAANDIQKNRDQPGGSSEFLLYQTEDGQIRIQVRLLDKTVWLNQRQIADLYQKSVPTINEHIANIFSERELTPEATIRKFRIVQAEGKRRVERVADFYDLDMILAVGYRVRSQRGTQFRQWATRSLREYLIKGFVLDDERLKRGEGEDYFDELLERIRAIRASERRFYQKITDIYATSSWIPSSSLTRRTSSPMLETSPVMPPWNMPIGNLRNTTPVKNVWKSNSPSVISTRPWNRSSNWSLRRL